MNAVHVVCCILAAPSPTTAVLVHTRRFNASDTSAAVFAWIDSLLASAPFLYELSSPSTSTKLTRDEASSKTLLELGFVPNIALIVRKCT